MEYLNYFKEKNRAGVVNLKNIVLYLLPPSEFTEKVCELKDKEIMGVFCDIIL